MVIADKLQIRIWLSIKLAYTRSWVFNGNLMGIVTHNLENKLKRISQLIQLFFDLTRNNISDTMKDPIKMFLQKDRNNRI